MQKKVSIIIPMYNSANFIVKSINSIMHQSYQNIEVVVVDDGSKDDSFDIVKRTFGDRVKLVHQENGGVSKARNSGLDMATGEYVMFVDSDDILSDEYAVEKCVREIEGYDQVIFNYNMTEANETIERTNFKSKVINFENEKARRDFIVNNFFRFKSGWCVWNRVFKKELISKNHISFSPKYNMGEDQLFCLEYLLVAKNVKIIDDALYNYEGNPDSIMHTQKMDLNRKNLMIHDRLALNRKNLIYYYLLLFREVSKNNKGEFLKIMKENVGDNWRQQIIKSVLMKSNRFGLVARLNIIKKVLLG